MAFAPVNLHAQIASTGTVAGTVTDKSGAAVPGATITLTSTTTGSARTTTSGAHGEYVIPYVNAGTYNLKVEKAGFQTWQATDQKVSVGTQLTVNPVLGVGSVTTTVNVTEVPGAELQTLNATVGTTISNTELVQLPNINRDAATLATLQAGSTSTGNSVGATADQNSFAVDAGYATDDMAGNNNSYVPSFASNYTFGQNQALSAPPSAVIPTPVSSIAEFKVSTANQTADFNGAAGSQVEMETKSGTNTFHGTVYEYYLDDNFGGANTWDNNNTGLKQPSYHYSRFGAAAGGKIPHSTFLGGNWYIFGNYEGFRYPLNEVFEENFPTPSLRAGLIKINGQTINLNPTATVDPATGGLIQPTQCPSGPCDPRSLGLNPVISALWAKYVPLPNDPSQGDGLNFEGYKSTLALPESSNFAVTRIDHDFAKNWHFDATYHYYKLNRATTNQWDVGGFFPGDTFGTYASRATRPQLPRLATGNLITTISPTVTNNFSLSYTRNYWAYETDGGVPNVEGYPATLEIGGERSDVYDPYNTNNQSTRTRVWDGRTLAFRDDLTMVHGTHLLQLGAMYIRDNVIHTRDDNGFNQNVFEQYVIGEGLSSRPNVDFSGYIPSGVTSTNEYTDLASEVLGLVNETHGLYTRYVGNDVTGLTLKPRVPCAITAIPATADCVESPPDTIVAIVPTYNVYLTDSWRVSPKLTLTPGLSYYLQMPSHSINGGYYTTAVDSQGYAFQVQQYLNEVQFAAEAGQAYDPILGISAVPNVPSHSKYPYNPFYGGISPRMSAAWNFLPNTVLRGGWARVYGRINGVESILDPLTAGGLLQTVTCLGPSNTGTCGSSPLNGFRVGPQADGTNAPLPPPVASLPQPWYPGLDTASTGASELENIALRPNQSDEFTLSIQRQINPKVLVEVGYMGRRISHDFDGYSINAVPYMMTEGGQPFANAWAHIMLATHSGDNTANIPVQPFFETALGGPNSAYCKGFANCTTAFVMNEGINGTANMECACVFDAWNDVSSAGEWVFGRTLQQDPIPNDVNGGNGQAPGFYMDSSTGWANFNAGYVQLTFTDWHGLALKSNFMWSKALGFNTQEDCASDTTLVNNWNLSQNYGLQGFDEKFVFNMFFNYTVPFYANQAGWRGRLLGGWTIAPFFAAGSGLPLFVIPSNGGCESYGEGSCNTDFVVAENAVKTGPVPSSSSMLSESTRNVFSNPAAVYSVFRNPILGLDGNLGGGGVLRGLPFWNMDLGITKKTQLKERMSSSLYFDITNVFNHMQPANPYFNLGLPANEFGALGGSCSGIGNLQANTPRLIQFGISLDW